MAQRKIVAADTARTFRLRTNPKYFLSRLQRRTRGGQIDESIELDRIYIALLYNFFKV